MHSLNLGGIKTTHEMDTCSFRYAYGRRLHDGIANRHSGAHANTNTREDFRG